MDRYFLPPEPAQTRPVILPVFIPFAGCPQRCSYCAQHLQTRLPPARHLDGIKANLGQVLRRAEAAGRRRAELAFYGGTFTLLPVAWQEELFALADYWRERGIIAGVRLSTRPDATPETALRRLRAWGASCIELGVQTFADTALNRSGRGYTGQEALEACRRVQDQGLGLGVQMLPGLPGMAPEDFRRDMDRCLALVPDLVRFYPCLVLRGTPLAGDWVAGKYAPWPLDDVAGLLAEAMRQCWRAGIRVGRVGLSLSDGFARDILAGPAHPDLGGLVRGLALFDWLAEILAAAPGRVIKLSVPRAWQGVFWGHGGELKRSYQKLGITPDNLRFEHQPFFRLQTDGPD